MKTLYCIALLFGSLMFGLRCYYNVLDYSERVRILKPLNTSCYTKTHIYLEQYYLLEDNTTGVTNCGKVVECLPKCPIVLQGEVWRSRYTEVSYLHQSRPLSERALFELATSLALLMICVLVACRR